jgi:uncharacterized cupin superfamily protein
MSEATCAVDAVVPGCRFAHPGYLLTLIEDGGETVLRAGDCAAFPKGSGNGHHMINRSGAMAVYLEVGSRQAADVTTCTDIDMMSSNADGRFVRKDGTPYPGA